MPNGNERGSAEDRRRRRQWLVETFGDGVEVMCHLELSDQCEMVLTVDTVTADRIIPGCDGGRYTRGNIRPACKPCQDSQGGRISAGNRALRCVAT